MQKNRIFKGAFTCRWAPSDGADGKDGEPGKDGTGIKSADVVFCVTESNTTEPSDNLFWYTTFAQLTMKENTYVWSCTKIILTDGTTKYTGKQCLGASKDFVTITEQYAVGSSPTTAPTSGWGTTYTPTKELWLWTRNRMEWKNSTIITFTYTTPICIGYFAKDGEPGSDGNGISSQTSYFIATDKKSVDSYNSVSGWSTTFPTPSDQKPYVWKCVKTIYTKSGTTYSTPELVTTYHSGDNGNILENASFTDADNMGAWNVKSQYRALSGKTAPQDLGSIDTNNKKDGRNSYHDTCKATGATITCKEMLRQKVHHPAGGVQKLAAGQWYTLSFWAKGRTKPIAIGETSSNYGFATKELYLTAGRTYTIKVVGKCDSTAVANGKELRTYIYATDWSESNSCATKSTSVTTMSMTFTPKATGAYRISSYQYDNTEPRTGKVTVQQYEITDSVDLVTYIYPTAVDTSTKMIVDGIEVTTPSDLGYTWKLTDEWTRHSVTFKTKQNLTTDEQNCLFRLMPAINEEGYREAWICMPKLESGMFATGFIDGIDDLRGIPGLIERTSEWSAGTEYHNDESLTGGIRYLDIVTVTDNTTGNFTMYQCRVTHTSTAANAPNGADSNEWLKLNQMRPIYTPLIVAKNAVLRFAQTNRILITNSKQQVQGCLGGVEDETNGYPLWIGGATAAAAKFKVKYGGQLEATDAVISGKITATDGFFNGSISIKSNSISEAQNIELNFDTGFNFSGCSYQKYGVQPYYNTQNIILPTDVKYNGVRCMIENTAKSLQSNGESTARLFRISVKDNSAFRINTLGGTKENITQLEVYGMGHVELHATLVDGKLRWVVDNADGFQRSSANKNVLSTWRGMRAPMVLSHGKYEFSNNTYYWNQILSVNDNAIFANRTSKGCVRFTFNNKLADDIYYMPVVSCEGNGYGWCSQKDDTGFTIHTNNDLTFEMMVLALDYVY